MTRPIIEWRTDIPPPNKKVATLSCWGVLSIGPVSKHEWESGFIVCWTHLPKKPQNWDELLLSALNRKNNV